MTRKRQYLFSVTAKDCVFQATRGSGPGGQARNKLFTAIRCTHEPSGAVGYSCDHKSQHRNKRIAFKRMAESKEFQSWVRLESSRRTGELARVESEVKRQMKPQNIKIEIHDEKGRWVEIDDE